MLPHGSRHAAVVALPDAAQPVRMSGTRNPRSWHAASVWRKPGSTTTFPTIATRT